MRDLILGLLGCLAVSGCEAKSTGAGELEPTESESAAGSGEGGGSCDGEVAADDFDRSCTVNADCVTVFEGPSTDACRCPGTAINVSERDAYLAEIGPLSCSEGECLADCAAGGFDQGACIEGTCELGQPFRCGDESCNAVGDFCVAFGTDIVGESTTYGCEALPGSCEDSTDCECLREADPQFNIDFCLDVGACEHDGLGFQVSCPGG